MASATTTSQTRLMTVLFPDKAIAAGYERSRFLALINKDERFFGETKYTVVDTAPTSGGSSSFSTAQANKGPTQNVRFSIQHKLEYQLYSISGPLLRRARDKGAIVDIYKKEMGRALYAFWRTMGSGIWGNGGGSGGTIGSISNDTITLSTKADISHFEKGMYVMLASDDGSGASPTGQLDGGVAAQITGIDHQSDTATITFGSNVTSIWASAAAGNNIFRDGDYGNKFTGVQGWNPITAPTSGDSFMGVDRTVAPSRLSGYRVSGSGGSKEETLIDAAAEAKFQGFNPTHVFANPLDIKGLFKTQAGNTIIDVGTDVPTVSFKAVQLATPGGMVTVIPETDVPKGYAWMLNPKNYTLRSAGACPQVLDDDGNSKLREATSDAYEYRMGCDVQLDCENPGECVIITW
jgi:hypothetical protein